MATRDVFSLAFCCINNAFAGAYSILIHLEKNEYLIICQIFIDHPPQSSVIMITSIFTTIAPALNNHLGIDQVFVLTHIASNRTRIFNGSLKI